MRRTLGSLAARLAVRAGFALVLAVSSIGCATDAGLMNDVPRDNWAERRGGVTTDGRLERLHRAAAPVLGQAQLARPVRLAILDTPRVGAYSFPDGRVFVSRGLADLLGDDDEALAAAVAHELGHLYRPAGSAQGLGGANDAGPGEPDEFRADATACTLLRTAGLDPGALADVLRLVIASPDTTPDQDRRLAERIRFLPMRSATESPR